MHFRVLNVFMVVLLMANMALPQIVWGQEKEPYSLKSLEILIKGKVSDEKIIEDVEKHGIDFYPDDEKIDRLREADASEKVIKEICRIGAQKRRKELDKTVRDMQEHTKQGEELKAKRKKELAIKEFEICRQQYEEFKKMYRFEACQQYARFETFDKENELEELYKQAEERIRELKDENGWGGLWEWLKDKKWWVVSSVVSGVGAYVWQQRPKKDGPSTGSATIIVKFPQ